MTLSKSGYVDIKAGQWVVAFPDEYFDCNRTLAENVERLKMKGAGWDWCVSEVLTIRRVLKVMPKTYDAPVNSRRDDGPKRREQRAAVIASVDTSDDALRLSAALLGIGFTAEERINREMYRLVAPFAQRETEAAIRKIHELLPHIFGEADHA